MPATTTETKVRKPRATPAAKSAPAKAASKAPRSASAPAKQGRQNHMLTLEKDDRATITAWKVSRPDGSMIGVFSTEATINEKLEKAGDSRRVKHGKIIEAGE